MMARWRRVVIVVTVLGSCFSGMPGLAEESLEDEARLRKAQEAAAVMTEDPVLKEQITKVAQALEQIHRQMAQRRQAIQRTNDEAQKSALYAELDGLRRERDLLERLVHELADEARATEWTAIDEALQRAKRFERAQDRSYKREEDLRERQQ